MVGVWWEFGVFVGVSYDGSLAMLGVELWWECDCGFSGVMMGVEFE